MGAAGESGYRLLGVQVVGRADVDHIRPHGGQHGRQIIERGTHRQRASAFQRPAADRHDLAAKIANQPGVNAGDAAAADNGCPHQPAASAALAASAHRRRWSRRASSKPLRTGAPSTTLDQKPSSSRM